MRRPIKRLAPAVLLVIFDGVPAVVHVEEPRQGMINQTLIINHKYVLRADIFQPDITPSRYQGEARAYDRLRTLGVPVPDTDVTSASRSTIRCSTKAMARSNCF